VGIDADDGLSAPDLERELSELAGRKAELKRERGLYRRLGFSTERVDLSLRRLEARRSQCDKLLHRLQGEGRGTSARFNGAHLETPHAT
jgi:hypothetical protein